MTNYNDGKWHGWNGGKCPVHPETMVEAVWMDDDPALYEGSAGLLEWEEADSPIIAFRVIKEHKEPREFWLNTGTGNTYISKDLAERFHGEIIHVREVIE